MPDQAVFPWQIWSGWERKRNRRTAEPLGKRSVLEAEPIGIVIKTVSYTHLICARLCPAKDVWLRLPGKVFFYGRFFQVSVAPRL